MDDYTLSNLVGGLIEVLRTLIVMFRRTCGWREARQIIEERDSRGWQPPPSWGWPIAIIAGGFVLAVVVYMLVVVLKYWP